MLENVTRLNYASFLSRLGAYLIDLIPIYIIIYITAAILGLEDIEYYRYHNEYIRSYKLFFYNGGWNGCAFLIWIIYSVFMDSSKYQGTLGKYIMKIKVTDTSGNRINLKQSLLRNLFKIISMFPGALGFIWIIFNSQKKGWHDIVANTLVLQEYKGLIFKNDSNII